MERFIFFVYAAPCSALCSLGVVDLTNDIWLLSCVSDDGLEMRMFKDQNCKLNGFAAKLGKLKSFKNSISIELLFHISWLDFSIFEESWKFSNFQFAYNQTQQQTRDNQKEIKCEFRTVFVWLVNCWNCKNFHQRESFHFDWLKIDQFSFKIPRQSHTNVPSSLQSHCSWCEVEIFKISVQLKFSQRFTPTTFSSW